MQINDSEGRISSLSPLRGDLCAAPRLAHLPGIARCKWRNLLLKVHLFFFLKVNVSKKKSFDCNWLFLGFSSTAPFSQLKTYWDIWAYLEINYSEVKYHGYVDG